VPQFAAVHIRFIVVLSASLRRALG
jgi:hypothetical protein